MNLTKDEQALLDRIKTWVPSGIGAMSFNVMLHQMAWSFKRTSKAICGLIDKKQVFKAWDGDFYIVDEHDEFAPMHKDTVEPGDLIKPPPPLNPDVRFRIREIRFGQARCQLYDGQKWCEAELDHFIDLEDMHEKPYKLVQRAQIQQSLF
jgi:hypothetical protein